MSAYFYDTLVALARMMPEVRTADALEAVVEMSRPDEWPVGIHRTIRSLRIEEDEEVESEEVRA